MKKFTRITAFVLCLVIIASCFAGCSSSSSKVAEEVSDKTLLIAYTDEKKPFIYEENGELKGFDVEVFEAIFNNIKNDYKDYKFVKVPADYRVGEEPAYEGYTAYIMAGGLEKNTGSFNQDCSFTESVIDNRIITVTAKESKIKNYNDLSGAKIGVAEGVAVNALEKNAVIKNNNKTSLYATASDALKDLDEGKLDAVVIDEFNFCVLENKDNYAVLDSELDTISYVYAFKKWDWYVDSINQAIKELQSPDYGDADEFTPIVEKYFGYDASNFEYNN